MSKAKALMVLGTASHVGKSVTVAALCRILHEDGFKVAPFKAQNMALNSYATKEGHEIGRAQAVQAFAAGLEPHVDMNPILLKPTSDKVSQIVLNGKVWGTLQAADFKTLKPQLFDQVIEAYERLASQYDYVILEGAGSPVEMNLKDGDMVNLRMAEAADARCMLVADIDRGGVFASLVGTYTLLEYNERSRFVGFIVNKFRGEAALFKPGVDFLEQRLGQPCLGVVPYMHNIRIDEEDSVGLETMSHQNIGGQSTGTEPKVTGDLDPAVDDSFLRICVVQLPHLSNFSDFSMLREMNAVSLEYSDEPATAEAADVIIIPGTKNTIGDLNWLKSVGWEDQIMRHAANRRPVIGICGGFQMLGRRVLDPDRVDGDVEEADGLGLLDVETWMTASKVTRQARAQLVEPDLFWAVEAGPSFEGYEIHMGETDLGDGARPLFHLTRLGDDFSNFDGAISDDRLVLGTYLHGLFDAPDAAEFLVAHLRELTGKPGLPDGGSPERSPDLAYAELAAHFRQHLDMAAIYRAMGIHID